MTTLSQQFESMKRAMKSQEVRKSFTSQYRTINTIKWKLLMLQTVDKLALAPQYDPHLIHDLKTIVNKISEERFIQAIVNMQPYKPNFKTTYCLPEVKQPRRIIKHHKLNFSPNKDFQDETTQSGSVLRRYQIGQIPAAKRLKCRQEMMAKFIEDDYLTKEISSPNHPYTKIIEGYSFILENKYKILIEKQLSQDKLLSLDQLMETVAMDFKLIQNFFKISSGPIVDIFKISDPKEKDKFCEEVGNFMLNYLRNNDKICLSIRKILRYHIKHSKDFKAFTQNCPRTAEIQKFDLPQKFRIEGCFIYTASEIISFSQLSKGKDCLSKLASIRSSIYKDIDEYYNSSEAVEVSSQVQLQILKFSLVKLQIFAGQILAQLKLLSILYGQQEMSYHFDEASYIHSQLSIAFQAIQHNL